MYLDEKESIIEAMLFASGNAVKIEDMAEILNVDGKTFAQTSISSINQLTKQTGKLGLKLK